MSNVEHPAHYGGEDNPYEAIKVLKAWGLENDAFLWNAGKYLARAGKKGPILEDLEKLVFYVNARIEDLKTQEEEPQQEHHPRGDVFASTERAWDQRSSNEVRVRRAGF
jgi:hypothetical protein